MFLSSTNPVILKIGSYQVFNFSTASILVQKTKFCHLDYCNTFLTGLWLLLWTHLRVRLILLKYNKSFTCLKSFDGFSLYLLSKPKPSSKPCKVIHNLSLYQLPHFFSSLTFPMPHGTCKQRCWSSSTTQ